MEMGKEIISKCNTFVPVGAGKAGIYILVYRVLKFHDAPLAWLKHEVKIVVRRGWG